MVLHQHLLNQRKSQFLLKVSQWRLDLVGMLVPTAWLACMHMSGVSSRAPSCYTHGSALCCSPVALLCCLNMQYSKSPESPHSAWIPTSKSMTKEKSRPTRNPDREHMKLLAHKSVGGIEASSTGKPLAKCQYKESFLFSQHISGIGYG